MIERNITGSKADSKQQENNEPRKIDLNAIYNAVRNLNADSQKTILSQYKFSELYQLFRDYEGYTNYISELIKGASAYLQTANALTELYNGVSWKMGRCPFFVPYSIDVTRFPNDTNTLSTRFHTNTYIMNLSKKHMVDRKANWS